MEGFMPIRMRHRDESTASTRRLGISAIGLEAMLRSQTSYAAIATLFRVLCGSI